VSKSKLDILCDSVANVRIHDLLCFNIILPLPEAKQTSKYYKSKTLIISDLNPVSPDYNNDCAFLLQVLISNLSRNNCGGAQNLSSTQKPKNLKTATFSKKTCVIVML